VFVFDNKSSTKHLSSTLNRNDAVGRHSHVSHTGNRRLYGLCLPFLNVLAPDKPPGDPGADRRTYAFP
jgi:hypothetical protein